MKKLPLIAISKKADPYLNTDQLRGKKQIGKCRRLKREYYTLNILT